MLPADNEELDFDTLCTSGPLIILGVALGLLSEILMELT
jgi:hypothetical protein